MKDDAILILGSGIAGLTAALALAPHPVILATKAPQLASGSSPWAQGGIAVALGAGDSAALHAEDTVAAGAGLTDPAMARLLARDGIEAVATLIADGAPFDRGPDGRPLLGREAAHRLHRIVHAGGDRTGRLIVDWLAERVVAAPHVTVLTEAFAADLAVADGAVQGALIHTPDHGWRMLPAHAVVLATGGWGMAWRDTTNPPENTGDGLAMAARAGALLADLEFMQFHPTALAVDGGGARLPLLTEALRGAGAHLLDAEGSRFVDELAPRDVVARAVGERAARGEAVFLDLRPALAAKGAEAFPQVLEACAAAGLDPFAVPVPVVPAAHYAMGGVVTDHRGRTSLPGLWAAGEVACTGVHGANRLASNSLLEGLVFARRVADDVRRHRPLRTDSSPMAAVPAVAPPAEAAAVIAEARALMSRYVGLVRDGDDLWRAGEALRDLECRLTAAESPDVAAVRAGGEARNLLTVARLITTAAEARRESRGAHSRTDFSEADPALAQRSTQRLGEAVAAARIPVTVSPVSAEIVSLSSSRSSLRP